MLQIILLSFALLGAILGLIFISIKKYVLCRFSFLIAGTFLEAYSVSLVAIINYSMISLVEVSYILLAIFSTIFFIYLLVNYIRKRS